MKYIKSIYERFQLSNAPVKPGTRPSTPTTPTTPTRPNRPARPFMPTTTPGEKDKTKPMANAPAKPGTRPSTAPPARPAEPVRPARPFMPTTTPGEKEKTKPIAEYEEMIDLFFKGLEEVKNTPEGSKMIKNLHKKYVK
jgi:hypothetical protein